MSDTPPKLETLPLSADWNALYDDLSVVYDTKSYKANHTFQTLDQSNTAVIASGSGFDVLRTLARISTAYHRSFETRDPSYLSQFIKSVNRSLEASTESVSEEVHTVLQAACQRAFQAVVNPPQLSPGECA